MPSTNYFVAKNKQLYGLIHEAEQIALDIAKINHTIPQSLSSKSSVHMPSKGSIRSNFDKNSTQFNDQARDIYYKHNDIADKTVEQMLIKKVDNTELEKVKLLDQLSSRVEDKKAQIQDKFDKNPESTIVRTGKQVADNIGISDKAIKRRNIKLPGYENENN
ncbi:MAG TPA: hypothetical protein LFV92_04970 [Rickettsia endosymbiont of Ceroptres masudai]|nr:hypothetical protein [Rickettsia endosymbiont of Ceroptres masudai]